MNQHTFDREYWEQHWTPEHGPTPGGGLPANPYLVEETRDLTPVTALDAGCGTGVEAIWLAQHGWLVTGVDISSAALAAAASRGAREQVAERVTWVRRDLTTWKPEQRWDLVTTSYAHPSIPQLEFYSRLGGWVVPGGRLLVVGHLHEPDAPARPRHDHPREATATLADIVALFDTPAWDIETARQRTRTVTGPGGADMALHDVVVRARRNG